VVGSRSKEPHSVGKVLSDKMVMAEALEAALGRIWGVFGSDPGANLPNKNFACDMFGWCPEYVTQPGSGLEVAWRN
jgi:hypothetical protein